MSVTKSLIILNPVSGVGDASSRREEVLNEAKKYGWRGEIIETTKKLTAQTVAKTAIKKGTNFIIVGGGDGTVMEVVCEAVDKNITVGVIPLGTGNVFARNLDIPLEIPEAVKTIFKGKAERIDVGRANGTYFGVNAGMGIDAELMHDTPRKLKDRLGILAYIIVATKKLWRKSGRYSVKVDKEPERIFRAKTVMIANMEETAGGIKAVPGAHPKNGRLSVGIIKAGSILDWLNLGFNALSGNVNKSSRYTLLSGKHIEITPLNGPRIYQCDGNDFPPATKLSIDIYPSSLSVITP